MDTEVRRTFPSIRGALSMSVSSSTRGIRLADPQLRSSRIQISHADATTDLPKQSVDSGELISDADRIRGTLLLGPDIGTTANQIQRDPYPKFSTVIKSAFNL